MVAILEQVRDIVSQLSLYAWVSTTPTTSYTDELILSPRPETMGILPGYSESIPFSLMQRVLIGTQSMVFEHEGLTVSVNARYPAAVIQGQNHSLGLSVVRIYLLLAFQFNSFGIPLIILVSIPLGFIGLVVSLFIFRSTLSLNSLLGAILLSGIVVNNAIILIDFYRTSVKKVFRSHRGTGRSRAYPIPADYHHIPHDHCGHVADRNRSWGRIKRDSAAGYCGVGRVTCVDIAYPIGGAGDPQPRAAEAGGLAEGYPTTENSILLNNRASADSAIPLFPGDFYIGKVGFGRIGVISDDIDLLYTW